MTKQRRGLLLNSQVAILRSICYCERNIGAHAEIGNGVGYTSTIRIDTEYLKIASEVPISAEHRHATLLK
jgi:hypothetical protein